MNYQELLQNLHHCPFCEGREQEIVRGGNLVYLTPARCPYTEDHVMVVPKRHVESLLEVTPEEQQEIGEMTQYAMSLLRKKGYSTMTVMAKEGPNSGKSIGHIHYHIVPEIKIYREIPYELRKVLTLEEMKIKIVELQKIDP